MLRNEINGGIASASNLGVLAARGEWIGFIDHDDALAPFALDFLNEALVAAPQAAFLYTDEVIADAKLNPTGYFHKPAYDPVLLSGVNYINHLSLYRRHRLTEIQGLRLGFDGSQDYDLLLRYLKGLSASSIIHLPYPAYLWRRDGTSFSATSLDTATAKARQALGAAYAKGGQVCPVGPALSPDLHRLRFDQRRATWPLVSVVVPNRDSLTLISRLLNDLYERTDYPNFEVIVIDNGTTDEAVLRLYEQYRQSYANFRAEITVEPFNFARQVNRGLGLARGEALLLLNNDIEVQEPNWLKEMVGCLDYADAGIVGARLLYPTGEIQHAGVIVGLGGIAGHWFGGSKATIPGPMGRLQVRQSLSAVTGACMLISRQCYAATGELDEESFAIAFNDVDFCIRAAQAGFRTIWTPFATLVHHESASRGSDETAANKARFQREKGALQQKYHTDAFSDPAFSPWYSNRSSTPREIIPEHLPQARHWPLLAGEYLDPGQAGAEGGMTGNRGDIVKTSS